MLLLCEVFNDQSLVILNFRVWKPWWREQNHFLVPFMVLIVSTVHLKPPLHRIGSINSSSIQFNTYENGYCDVFIIESCELYQKKHRGRDCSG